MSSVINSRSRDRSEARLEQESEPDQDIVDGMEDVGNDLQAGAAFERLVLDRTDRFDRNMFRSLSLEHWSSLTILGKAWL